jgi:hypothetical protein
VRAFFLILPITLITTGAVHWSRSHDTKHHALLVMKKANQKKSDAAALFLTATLAMELREHHEFRLATLQLARDFPEKSESHYLNAILAASDKDWTKAEDEMKRAGDMSLSADLVRQFLESTTHEVQGQPAHDVR